MDIQEKIKTIPDSPGVYLMKDITGNIIYVGKAKSLKKRLVSYFARNLSAKTIALMSFVCDIEYRLTPTESMALLLEAALIQKYKPKYNISLRDDKSFPLIKITNEEFPTVFITRRKENDNARYFGPYANAGLLKDALKIIRRQFPYRSCKKMPKKACIYYRIGLSPAPCIGKIEKKQYAKSIEKISLLLEGKTDDLLKKLSEEMSLRALDKNYEEAAKIRDQIIALGAIDSCQVALGKQAEIEDLKRLLKLKRLPFRIEAFDISNISGSQACGSMVSFYKGLPDKKNYRRFRIKTVEGINDYKMLTEVIRRRYSGAIKDKLMLPDLVVVDGGSSHLSVAERELKEIGLNLPLISIAKKKENIYIQSRKRAPIKLNSDTAALNLIRRVRDEAHRFAISYHRLLRRKKTIGG